MDDPITGESHDFDDDPTPERLAQFLADIANEPDYPLNEKHVHGSIIEQTVRLLDDHMKPTIGGVVDPADGTSLPVVTTRDGYEVIPAFSWDAFRDAPLHQKGKASLHDLASFIDHANRFKDDDTVIFAENVNQPIIGAVFDYSGKGAPRFGRHTSNFHFPLSDEWKAWTAINGKKMAVRDFAEFLEDHVIDLLEPQDARLNDDQQRFVNLLGGVNRIGSPVKMMEVSTGLRVVEEAEATQAVKLSSGETQFTYKATHSDGHGGAVSVPAMFLLGIPVFRGGEPYQVLARFRYRKNGAELSYMIDLWRTDRVMDHAFDEAVEAVRNGTGLTVLLGRPEA